MTGLRTRGGWAGVGALSVAVALLLAPTAYATPESDADAAISHTWDAAGGGTCKLQRGNAMIPYSNSSGRGTQLASCTYSAPAPSGTVTVHQQLYCHVLAAGTNASGSPTVQAHTSWQNSNNDGDDDKGHYVAKGCSDSDPKYSGEGQCCFATSPPPPGPPKPSPPSPPPPGAAPISSSRYPIGSFPTESPPPSGDAPPATAPVAAAETAGERGEALGARRGPSRNGTVKARVNLADAEQLGTDSGRFSAPASAVARGTASWSLVED